MYYPALVTAVTPNSVAAQAGIQPGDQLLSLNGEPLRDVIDVQVYAAEPKLTFLVDHDGVKTKRAVTRQYGQPLGLEFASAVFKGPMRVCRNNCEFCFVSQMPPGLRPSLYVKDDDYRYSFLHGSYITLTNLTTEDWNRIEEQFLSPLYVSVHATEPDVRAVLLHNPHAGDIMAHLTRLAHAGIEVHTQVVLVPGRNDGAHLDRTISDLATLYPHVATLTVVPVGLTHHHAPTLRPYTDGEASEVLKQLLNWQTRLKTDLGVNFVYPADEWFLRAGVHVPPLTAYDGQLDALVENGVGMVRQFLDAEAAQTKALAELQGSRQIWITGTLFAPLLKERARIFMQQTGSTVEVVPVSNHTFGETVTVAGLLTVSDVLTALRNHALNGIIVLPEAMFRGPEGQALDGQFPDAIAKATGCLVYVV